MSQGFRLGSSVKSTAIEQSEIDEGTVSINRALLSIDYASELRLVLSRMPILLIHVLQRIWRHMTTFVKGTSGSRSQRYALHYLVCAMINCCILQTKKKRSSRRTPIDNEILGGDDMDQMEVDEKPVVPRTRELDANFVDDDELQAALARQRRATIHKAKKLSPEEIARKSGYTLIVDMTHFCLTAFLVAADRAREQSPTTDDIIKVEEAEEETGDSGLTFDDTSEFVRSISYNPAAVKVDQVEPSVAPPPPKARSPSYDGSMREDEVVDEIEAGEVVLKEEDDEEMLEAIEQAIKDTEEGERVAAENGEGEAAVGSSSEPTFGSGMAGTLALLRQQGLLAQPTDDQAEREKVQRQRDVWLADYRRMLAQRELDRLQARGGNKDQATREYENRVREQQESRAGLELFKNYKPDINIVYYDEFGRTLTPKEAWKALSHKFHGKGSGKMKTEKRLKKIAEEKKKEAMASGDTPLSMNKAFQIRQEKTGQAHFVLSVGNRGYVFFSRL